jgi:HEPN domain-containing protein
MGKKGASLWMNAALHDMKTSRYNREGRIYDAACFYAQQAAEKSLKSLILASKDAFPKVHDLTKLAKLLNAPPPIIAHCASLNPVYTASRYPDELRKYSQEDCDDVILSAEEVVSWAKKTSGL